MKAFILEKYGPPEACGWRKWTGPLRPAMKCW